MLKKNKIFIKKEKKKLLKKKKIFFKLNKKLEYLKILKILNNHSILIFFQFISLDNENDNNFFKFFLDRKLSYIFLTKAI